MRAVTNEDRHLPLSWKQRAFRSAPADGAAPDNPINKRARYFEDLFEKEENDDDGEDYDK